MKSSKKEANYRKGNVSRHCSMCTMWKPPAACTAVKGTIKPGDLCDYYKKKLGAGRGL